MSEPLLFISVMASIFAYITIMFLVIAIVDERSFSRGVSSFWEFMTKSGFFSKVLAIPIASTLIIFAFMTLFP